jgi:cell division protein FtsQ
MFSHTISSIQSQDTTCNQIKVIIKDSAQNRFITPLEIKSILKKEGIETKKTKIKSLNIAQLEKSINNKTVVKKSQISYTITGSIIVEIMQRRPILRFETNNGGFYMDETAYLFPLVRSFTSYVPVISGDIPLDIPSGYRGYIEKNRWAKSMRDLGLYLEKDGFWNSMIDQVFVNNKGELILIPKNGTKEIFFGKPEEIDSKFKKLFAYYDKVVYIYGWDYYKSVDLRFSNQIVCKK